MKTKAALSVLALLLSVFLAPPSAAQDASASGSSQEKKAASAQSSSDQPPEGVEHGNYTISQSLELGYRWTSDKGNGRTFNSLVNLHQGFRVLSQTLSMRSLNHTGMLFDHLNISSFGWNGDPTNAARWSVSKNKIFNFSGNFRRDQNFFDYDLFANPLNPTSFSPNFPVPLSPHSMELRRRMSDMALTILPQAPVSVRLGYVRNNMTGPSFSSFHEGTDVLLLQNWNTTLNGYRIGVDFKVLPRTIISYDQSLDYFKNDTDFFLQFFPVDASGNTFVVTNPTPGGSPIPVAIGLPFNPPARQPCATVFLADGTVNPACSVYEAYARAHRYRSSQPTEQLTIQGNYFRHIDFVGRISYASSDATDDLNPSHGFGEAFLGVVTRTGVNERAFTLTGLSSPRRISTTIDLGATVHLSDTWRVPISFRSANFRTPGLFDFVETVFSPTTPATIGGPIGDPVVTAELSSFSFNRKDKRLEGGIEHDFTKSFGARLGTRWIRHDVFHFDFSEDEPDFTRVNEYTALVGLWYRTNSFRANFDVEAGSADNFLYRVSPRHQQRYRLRFTHNPKPWAVVSAYANVWQGLNTETLINYKGRNRNFGFNLNVTPNNRFGIDLAYNFNLYSQNSFICFIGSFSPPGTTTTAAGSPCADASLPNQVYSFYNDHIHYFSTAFYFRPVARVTANLGYSLNHSEGDFTRLNQLQPLAQMNANYHQPLANLAIELHKNVTWNLGWNYWNYRDENGLASGASAPSLPRNFHANMGTASLKFAF